MSSEGPITIDTPTPQRSCDIAGTRWGIESLVTPDVTKLIGASAACEITRQMLVFSRPLFNKSLFLLLQLFEFVVLQEL